MEKKECPAKKTPAAKKTLAAKKLVAKVCPGPFLLLPALFPKEAGTCPPGQKCWTVTGPNGGKVGVELYRDTFYVLSAKPGNRNFKWHTNGIVAAWEAAKKAAHF